MYYTVQVDEYTKRKFLHAPISTDFSHSLRGRRRLEEVAYSLFTQVGMRRGDVALPLYTQQEAGPSVLHVTLPAITSSDEQALRKYFSTMAIKIAVRYQYAHRRTFPRVEPTGDILNGTTDTPQRSDYDLRLHLARVRHLKPI